jgi:hypothetical protein
MVSGKPVDEVETAGAASSRAGGETAGELSLSPGRKSAGLFMPHVDPIDPAAVNGMGDAVERIADDAVTRLDAGSFQRFDQ